MKTVGFLLGVLTLVLNGCSNEISVSPQEKPSQGMQMELSHEGRPSLDFMGPYNVSATEFEIPVDSIWTERDDIPELSLEEFYRVRAAVVRGISKHSTVYGEVDGDSEFYVYDDKFFDRTQKVEITPSPELSQSLPAVIAELQEVLKEHPLWRVMFVGEGYEEQARQTHFVVYPDVVRIRQLDKSKTVAEAVRQNSQLRQRFIQERKKHQEQRNAALKKAVQSAIERMNRSDDEVLLVAWYDTLSVVDWDWGGEGQPGSSIWLLVRSPTTEDEIETEFKDFYPYWVTKDGKINLEKSESEPSFQLWLFEDSELIVDKLEIKVSGKKYSFTSPQS